MNSRIFLILPLLCFVLSAIPAEARLGFTKAEWEAKFGKPDAKNVYHWEGPGRRVRQGPR